MKNRGFYIFILMLLAGLFLFGQCGDAHTEVVENCKVKKLVEQQKISGTKNNMHTNYRYLVITDKETFICDSNMLQGKFDNSDIFYNLKVDSTYTFKVSGYHKNWFYDYRNILEIVK